MALLQCLAGGTPRSCSCGGPELTSEGLRAALSGQLRLPAAPQHTDLILSLTYANELHYLPFVFI